MIHKAISAIEKKLETYLTNRFLVDEKIVAIANVGQNSSGIDITQNKVLITLVNIEREYVMGVNFKTSRLTDKLSATNRPPVHLNLNVLFSSNFIDKNYDEALKYISAITQFIQRNDLMDKHSTPELNPNIERLQLEIVNLSVQELSNLWSIFGGKYIPSILCKIRMLTVDSDEDNGVDPIPNHP
ncbi:MAG: DUF4255 domain-containing protein [Bacteroidales bacterium]|nr:DUF4255 domain-containing protein [Bacteroidales bacterium]MCF8458137.1 DUF4255 domain-containing protein [Bacteroidales bacterium]